MTTFINIYLLIGIVLSTMGWIRIITKEDDGTHIFFENIYDRLVSNRDICGIILTLLGVIIADLVSVVFWPIIVINSLVTR